MNKFNVFYKNKAFIVVFGVILLAAIIVMVLYFNFSSHTISAIEVINLGQTNDNGQFVARNSSYTFYKTNSGNTYDLYRIDNNDSTKKIYQINNLDYIACNDNNIYLCIQSQNDPYIIQLNLDGEFVSRTEKSTFDSIDSFCSSSDKLYIRGMLTYPLKNISDKYKYTLCISDNLDLAKSINYAFEVSVDQAFEQVIAGKVEVLIDSKSDQARVVSACYQYDSSLINEYIFLNNQNLPSLPYGRPFVFDYNNQYYYMDYDFGSEAGIHIYSESEDVIICQNSENLFIPSTIIPSLENDLIYITTESYHRENLLTLNDKSIINHLTDQIIKLDLVDMKSDIVFESRPQEKIIFFDPNVGKVITLSNTDCFVYELKTNSRYSVENVIGNSASGSLKIINSGKYIFIYNGNMQLLKIVMANDL